MQAHVFDALLDFFVRGKNNPHFENYVCDLQVNKLDKICNVQDSKFVSWLLCITKRPKSADSAPAQLSFKPSPAAAVEQLDEDNLKKRVKFIQYEALVYTDVRQFKKGQFFQQYTEQTVDGIPRYNLIVRDAENEAQFAQKTMCCFVVPLGCEREMDIYNPEK